MHSYKVRIDAVLDEEIDSLLEQLGVKEEFDMGRSKCSVCGDTVNRENLKIIIPSGNRFEFLCDKPSCMIRLALGD